MSGRLLGLGVALALFAGLGALAPGCYDVPMPDCGFVCGPDNACPDGYTCANDHRCRRDDAPPTLMCAPPDAGAP